MPLRFSPSAAAVVVLALCAQPLLMQSVSAQDNSPRYTLQNGSDTRALRCATHAGAVPPRVVSGEEFEPPDGEEIDELGQLLAKISADKPAAREATPTVGAIPRRIAIWGDSHLAAGSFAAELRRVLGAQGVKPRSPFLPLTMGRAGVILPLRRHCMEGWKSELAYSARQPMLTTGIGMNTLHGETEAYLWLDLRNDAGEADVQSVELYFRASAGDGSIAVSIDGGPEGRVALAGDGAFGVITITGTAPMSVLKIRVQQQPVVLRGLYLNYRQPPVAVLDAFGIPGATARSWQQIDPFSFSQYFRAHTYDMVMLEFGTNEGNARPFDATGYRRMLGDALRNLRTVFPEARCLLIGPGDRGMLLPKSRKAGGKKSESRKGRSAGQLLQFSLIHDHIFRIQKEEGARYGCDAWSMQAAMGGQGGAYRWLLASPPLMARDLTHFTSRGYQRLAQDLADSLGWTEGLLPLSVPGRDDAQ
jgi:lysophospholipase L1-like esterase